MGVLASGKNSIAECMRCGFQYDYSDMIEERKNVWVCKECNDGQWNIEDHIGNKPIIWTSDPEALEHPFYGVEACISAAGAWNPNRSSASVS